ncbi:MAG: hypothetical protein RL134_374 [Actinomycetota bacterium]|jgi:hypothetical protein
MAAKGARVHIYGDWDGSGVKKAQQDISTFEKQAAGFTGAFSKSMLGVGAALGGAFAVGSIISTVTDYLRDAATAAMQDEKSMVALSTAMKNVGQGFANAGAEDFIKQMMLATGVADDQLRPAFQRLVTATGNAAKSQELLQTALDVSAATGKDVVAVSQALARASTGQVSALTRLGVPLDANIVKTKDFGAAVDALNQKFGGQAAAAADTYAGQMARIQTAAGEAQETIGYALLDAVENASQAFGGAGGMVEGITAAGEKAADLVAGLGLAVQALADLKAGADDTQVGIGGATISLGELAKQAVLSFPGVRLQAEAFEFLTSKGNEYRTSQDAINRSIDASESLYAGYIASLDNTAASTRDAEADAEELKQRLDEVKASFVAMTNAMNASQSMDDFRKSLVDLDKTLEGNKRSFKGMGDAAKENRDTLRGAFGDAAAIAQKWAEDNGKSAEEAQRYYDGLARKIVNQFTKDGFKRSDVEQFLGREGIWTGPAKDALDAAERAAMAKAYPGFKGVGTRAGEGMKDGIAAMGPGVMAAAARLAAQAAAAAKDELVIKSPSQVFMEIGRQTIAGFVEGMASKDAEVREQARKSMRESVSEVINDTRDQLKSALADAKAAFADFQKGVSDAVMGGIDFGAAAPEFDEAGNRVGSSFLEGLRKQAEQAVNFATQVKTLITQGLSQEALQQVLAAGVTAGSAIATELINGGTTAINETNALVASTQAAADEVGLMAATNFYGAGVTSARETVKAFNEQMKPGGDGYDRLMNRMDKLAADMNRTARITVVVDEVGGAKVKVDGKREKGGPVWPGGAFIVGERGPELFMPEVKGTILPSASMTSSSSGGSYGGGNSYSITVQAGVGDPRQIGQQVVEYIKRFESANGNVFAAA